MNVTKSWRNTFVIAAMTVVLTGCTALKNLTGSNDDTVLPGQREDVLPPDQQTARDPIVTGEQQTTVDAPTADAPCDPNDPNCLAPIDQEQTSGDQ